MVDGHEDFARAQRRHDRVGRASGELMEQDGAFAVADRQARGVVRVGRASAHCKVALPLPTELADDTVGLLLGIERRFGIASPSMPMRRSEIAKSRRGGRSQARRLIAKRTVDVV
jgi:hypothetical protein